MSGRTLLFSILLVTIITVIADEDIILKPLNNVGTPCALIIVQGAATPTDRYIPTAQAIQKLTSPSLSLWVSIPKNLMDFANPLTIDATMKGAISNLQGAGLNSSIIFVAGHSLGAVITQSWTKANAKLITGQILLGAYLLRTTRDNYPVPTLTVGGELDGLSRITRIAESFYTQIVVATNPDQAKLSYPVVVVEGMSHNQFASGEPPSLVKAKDLKPEITYDEAHNRTAWFVSLFLRYYISKDSYAAKTLLMEVVNSGKFLEPLYQSLVLEGYYKFKKPCNDDPPSDACLLGSQWSAYAQTVLGGKVSDGIAYNVTDTFHLVYDIFPVHLPYIKNTCQKGDPKCMLQMVTVTQNVYDLIDFDTAASPISASEMRVKMKSRQAVIEAAGYGPADFNQTDSESLCAEINSQAISYALSSASEKTLARYLKIGVQLKVGEDQGPYNAGPLWIWKSLEAVNGTDAAGQPILTYLSPMMKTPTDYFISASRGFHYCKLLSPARALEWIYVDSLRLRGSIAN